MFNAIDKKQFYKSLEADGYASVGELDSESFRIVQQEVDKILSRPAICAAENKSPSWDMPVVIHPYKQLTTNLFGKSERLDQVLRPFIENHLIPIANEISGKNCKLTTCHVREADFDSFQNPLHQDNFGQFSFALLLNEVTTKFPTTVFMRGSHYFPYDIYDKLEGIPMGPIRGLLVPCTGPAGHVFSFFNKTWHGMIKSQVKVKSRVLLFAFIGEGTAITPNVLPEMTEYGKDYKEMVGPVIWQKISPTDNLEKNILDKGQSLIIQKTQNAAYTLGQKVQDKDSYGLRSLTYSLLAAMCATGFKFLRNCRSFLRPSSRQAIKQS